MAEKRPLCLYGGRVKRLQPGDTIIGAYNATEAGWIVNASGYLVATPGTVKTTSKVVTGSIWAINSTGIVMRVPLAGPVFNIENDGQVVLGSAAAAAQRLHIQKKGSEGTGMRITNDTTGHLVTDGFLVGLDASEQALIKHFENTNMLFYTNNLLRYRIKNDGVMHAYYGASLDSTLKVGGHVTAPSANITSLNTTTATVTTLGITTANITNANITTVDAVNASLSGNASIDGTLKVGGGVTFNNTLLVKSANASFATITITNGNYVKTDGVYARDSGGLNLYDDSGAAGIQIADGGGVTFTHGITGNSTMSLTGAAVLKSNASINGYVLIGGDLVVTGSLRVKDEGHYIGDNTLGDNAADTQKLIGIGIASGPFSVYQAFVGKLTASINSTLKVGGAVTLSAHTTAPSANITSLNTTTATVTTLGVTTANITNANITTVDAVNASLSGNASIDGTLKVGGAVTLNNTLLVKSANASFATITLTNSNYLKTDGVYARDSGGLILRDDAGTNGITIADGGAVTFTHGITGNSTMSLTGAAVMKSTASINSTLKVGGAVTLSAHTTAPSANITSLNVTTATIGTLNVNVGNLTVGASVVASTVRIGGLAGTRLKNCTINASGAISAYTGDDLMLNTVSDTTPDQQFIAEKVWNAVYNDVVDWQDLADGSEAIYGKVYVDSYDGARIPTVRCQKSVIGICSDTFGFAVGRIQERNQIPISVAGWALAHVDRAYESGEPLTNTSSGCLTCMTATEKREYPERLVAIYKRPETASLWQGRVKVNGRHWVKVR